MFIVNYIETKQNGPTRFVNACKKYSEKMITLSSLRETAGVSDAEGWRFPGLTQISIKALLLLKFKYPRQANTCHWEKGWPGWCLQWAVRLHITRKQCDEKKTLFLGRAERVWYICSFISFSPMIVNWIIPWCLHF